MRLKTQQPKTPPCMLTETFSHVLILGEEDTVVRTHHDAAAVMKWGMETFGRFGKRWAFSSARISKGKITAYFHSEADAMLFAMRWRGGEP